MAGSKRAGKPGPKRARPALSAERILEAALRLADAAGVEALSMRKLAAALGVEAMSLYKHVADKDAVLDGLVDLVAREIGMPRDDGGWKTALRQHAVATRQACLQHRWAAALLEARGGNSPTRMRYANALLGLLRRAGFTVPQAYRAFLLVDSYLYGFVVQEVHFPSTEEEIKQMDAMMTARLPAAEYPALVEAMTHVMKSPRGRGFYDAEFASGLELILDGLDRVRRGAPGDEPGAHTNS